MPETQHQASEVKDFNDKVAAICSYEGYRLPNGSQPQDVADIQQLPQFMERYTYWMKQDGATPSSARKLAIEDLVVVSEQVDSLNVHVVEPNDYDVYFVKGEGWQERKDEDGNRTRGVTIALPSGNTRFLAGASPDGLSRGSRAVLTGGIRITRDLKTGSVTYRIPRDAALEPSDHGDEFPELDLVYELGTAGKGCYGVHGKTGSLYGSAGDNHPIPATVRVISATYSDFDPDNAEVKLTGETASGLKVSFKASPEDVQRWFGIAPGSDREVYDGRLKGERFLTAGKVSIFWPRDVDNFGSEEQFKAAVEGLMAQGLVVRDERGNLNMNLKGSGSYSVNIGGTNVYGLRHYQKRDGTWKWDIQVMAEEQGGTPLMICKDTAVEGAFALPLSRVGGELVDKNDPVLAMLGDVPLPSTGSAPAASKPAPTANHVGVSASATIEG